MRNRTQFRRHAVPPEPGIQPPRQARRFITIHHISSQFRIHAGRRTGAPRNSAPSLEFKTKPIPIFGHYSRGCRTFTSRSTNSKPNRLCGADSRVDGNHRGAWEIGFGLYSWFCGHIARTATFRQSGTWYPHPGAPIPTSRVSVSPTPRAQHPHLGP